MDNKQKANALKSALGQLEKKYGVGTIMKMGDKPKQRIEAIPTGAINLDAALGIGGIPKGRVTEIYGAEASGKTTLTLHIAAEAQKQGGVIAFIDAEHALDPEYASRIGVDTEEMLLSQPDGGEQALEIVETLIRSNAVDLIIIDSVAALVTRQEIEGEMGDSHVGLQARLMSQALRKLTAIVSKSNTSVIFINQTRMKIGTTPYMNPETTTGGVALKFYSSVRIQVRSAGSIKDVSSGGVSVIGNIIKAKIVKNKFAPPFKTVEFPLIYGKGISNDEIIIDIAVKNDIIKKSGSWFSYGSTKIGQGMEKVKAFLAENSEIKEEIETAVKKTLFPEVSNDKAQENPEE